MSPLFARPTTSARPSPVTSMTQTRSHQAASNQPEGVWKTEPESQTTAGRKLVLAPSATQMSPLPAIPTMSARRLGRPSWNPTSPRRSAGADACLPAGGTKGGPLNCARSHRSSGCLEMLRGANYTDFHGFRQEAERLDAHEPQEGLRLGVPPQVPDGGVRVGGGSAPLRRAGS